MTIIRSGCVAVLLAVHATAGVNLLTNPGLETGDFKGWTCFTESQNWRISSWPADIHSGTFGMVNDVYASGGDEWRGVFQLVPVTEGHAYTYTAYQRAAAMDNDASESYLEIHWLNTSGDVIGQWQATHITVDQDWLLMGSNNLTAPAGAVTASVRAIVHVRGTPANTDWHVADDFVFEETESEPGSR